MNEIIPNELKNKNLTESLIYLYNMYHELPLDLYNNICDEIINARNNEKDLSYTLETIKKIQDSHTKMVESMQEILQTLINNQNVLQDVEDGKTYSLVKELYKVPSLTYRLTTTGTMLDFTNNLTDLSLIDLILPKGQDNYYFKFKLVNNSSDDISLRIRKLSNATKDTTITLKGNSEQTFDFYNGDDTVNHRFLIECKTAEKTFNFEFIKEEKVRIGFKLENDIYYLNELKGGNF